MRIDLWQELWTIKKGGNQELMGVDEVEKELQGRGKCSESTSIKGSINFSQLIVGWHPLDRPGH